MKKGLLLLACKYGGHLEHQLYAKRFRGSNVALLAGGSPSQLQPLSPFGGANGNLVDTSCSAPARQAPHKSHSGGDRP